MSGIQMILGVLTLAALSMGAGFIGYSMIHAAKAEKPKLLLIGISVFGIGAILGYTVVELFLVLEGQSH